MRARMLKSIVAAAALVCFSESLALRNTSRRNMAHRNIQCRSIQCRSIPCRNTQCRNILRRSIHNRRMPSHRLFFRNIPRPFIQRCRSIRRKPIKRTRNGLARRGTIQVR